MEEQIITGPGSIPGMPLYKKSDPPLKAREEERVLLALSGGVDSSVAIQLLRQQGFKVEAVVISFSPAHKAAIEAAVQVAGELRVPISVLRCEELFERTIIAPFCNAYANGRTPSPCVLCNPGVKFRILAEEADRRGIQYIASGHYARLVKRSGESLIAKAASAERDQSYMLYRLPKSIRSRLCLPVGEYTKPAIREMALLMGLSSADAPDSQEICFIPSGDYPAFIRQRGITGLQGEFISPDGERLGPHKGVLHYTVGQRKGLGIALGVPVFIRRIEANGDIHLATSGGEYSSGVRLTRIVTADDIPLEDGARYTVKIRSAATPVPGRVQVEGGRISLLFDTPQRAAAPGQHAVLYTDDLVIGGGEIEDMFD